MTPPRPRRWRRLVYAALATLAVLAVLELVGRLAMPDPRTRPGLGGGSATPQGDPTAPVVVEESPGRWTFAHAATGRSTGLYHDQHWRVPAADGIYRIIAVGDSTVYGPFPHALAAGLVVPGRTVEVLNFGSNGFASGRSAIAGRAALTQDPELVVFYAGHNEVMQSRLDPRSLDPMWLRAARSRVVHSGIGRLVGMPVLRLREALRGEQPPPPENIHWDPADCHPLTDEEWVRVGHRYRENLYWLAAAADAAGVPLALVEPVSSLLADDDIVPAAQLADPEIATVDEGLDRCRDGEAEGALRLGDELAARFPELGEPQLLRGCALLALGRRDEALTALLDARRREYHATRACDRHAAVLREVAQGTDALFVPTEATFLADARYLELDDPLFIDEMHPSPEGNVLLARAVVEGLRDVLPAGSHYDANRVDRDSLHWGEPAGWRPTGHPVEEIPPQRGEPGLE